MPVPNTMADLLQAAASNSPAGSEAIGNSLDNYLRAYAAILRQTNALASSSIAAASTINVSAADGESVQITGAATINSLGTGFNGCRRELRFTGACTLTHSTNLILPSAQNITTVNGSVLQFRCIGSNVWIWLGSNDIPAGALPQNLEDWAAIPPADKWDTANATERGLNGAVNIADYNDALSYSRFFRGGGASTNTPAAATVALYMHYDADAGAQIAADVQADALYFRRRLSGGFQPWRSIWHAGNFTPTNIPAQTAGTSWGSTLATGASLANHLALFGTTYGFNIVSGAIQVVFNGSAHTQFTAAGIVAAGTVSDANGNLRKIKSVTVNATQNFTAAQLNGVVDKTTNNTYTWTIPQNLGTTGDAITIVNSGTAGNVVVARGTGVTLLRNGVNANVTVGPGSILTIYQSGTVNRWVA